MLTIFTYTFHASALLILSLVIYFIRVKKGYMEHKYRKLLVVLSILFAMNIPCDLLVIYNQLHGVSNEYLAFFVFRFVDIVSVSVVIMAFHYFLGTPRRQLHIAQYTIAALLVLCFLHVVLYSNYRADKEIAISLESYTQYCSTVPAITLQYVIYTVLFVFIAFSLAHFFYISRLYNLAFKHFESEIGDKKKLLSSEFRHIYHLICFYAIDFLWPSAYYDYVVVFWIAVSLGWALFIINNKEEIIATNRLAAFIYVKVESAHHDLSWLNVILGREVHIDDVAETDEEKMFQREKAIVTRAVVEWENSPERYFDKPNYTFRDYAEQIGIPMGVLLKHGVKYNGCDFDEYINNLRELK